MEPGRDLSAIPSVDKIISHPQCLPLIDKYGHQRVTSKTRLIVDEIRNNILNGTVAIPDLENIVSLIDDKISQENQFSLKPVLNLTGTVLHTNLGRAVLPESAITGINTIARGPSNLEYDLDSGQRGDRDSHVENLISELTGAEAATVVNNNAAAVLLTLNTLALGKEVPVSRGELVEIGGSFRIPEIMARSGCTLVEVGATNRTHLKDYEKAIGNKTAALMKVHTSNYQIQGFTHEVNDNELAELASGHGIPFINDLGSGTLIDLSKLGLPKEPTVAEAIVAGADIVTFSGDKLLGGPQAGIIVGTKSTIAAIKANPLKRALRVDKLTMVALYEVLKLYQNPDRIAQDIPTIKYLTKSVSQISDVADRVIPVLTTALKDFAQVSVVDCHSQIGSGSMPLDLLPSRAISMIPLNASDKSLQQLMNAFRQLPIPVIGRIHDGKLLFDLRTLENPDDLLGQLDQLSGL